MPVKCIWQAGCLLGESPVWDAERNQLWFVDIKARRIHGWNDHGGRQSYDVSGEIGSLVLRQNGGVLAAIDQSLLQIDFAPFSEQRVEIDFAEPPRNRFNDGKCDAAGRYWVASMDNDCRRPSGRIWRITPDYAAKCMAEGHVVGNGFGWSPDNQWMYFTDSENRRIMIYPFEVEDGGLGRPEVFAEVPVDAGLPDGLAVDAEGHVWSAHWDGWRITRYRPNGDIDGVVPMPVPRPTSLAFGGEDLSRLFVTSASMGLSDVELRDAPLSGGLFEVMPTACGLPAHRFSG